MKLLRVRRRRRFRLGRKQIRTWRIGRRRTRRRFRWQRVPWPCQLRRRRRRLWRLRASRWPRRFRSRSDFVRRRRRPKRRRYRTQQHRYRRRVGRYRRISQQLNVAFGHVQDHRSMKHDRSVYLNHRLNGNEQQLQPGFLKRRRRVHLWRMTRQALASPIGGRRHDDRFRVSGNHLPGHHFPTVHAGACRDADEQDADVSDDR